MDAGTIQEQGRRSTPPPRVAWRALGAISVALSAVLVATSGRYGYHRDELYFLRAGRSLAFGYPDQPPLTPLLARIADGLFGGSLVGLRLPSAVAAALVVLLTGLIARELGGATQAQTLAAASMAVSAILLAVGHLLSTSTFDLLAWTAVSWLVIRALDRRGARDWLAVGLVAGLGLQNKTLIAFLLAALVVALLVTGPRDVLRSRWPWAAAAVALVLWAPNLLWQATHGWPQLELSAAIAGGSSGTSEPWFLFLPFQLVLVSPLLVPLWLAGLWRLARDPTVRRYRGFALAYALLAVVFMATGGKPYYLTGLYPVLLAAGAEPTLRWVRVRATRLRRAALGAAIALSAAISAVLMLPLVPVQSLGGTPVADINYDAGETVGWPRLVGTVEDVYRRLPAEERGGAVVLTRNYGQAGAVDRFGGELGLPTAYSGHNGYAEWGPPPDSATTAVVVGYDQARLGAWFADCEEAARVDNGVDLENDEQGTPIWVCRDRTVPWTRIWPEVRLLG